jgi:16S rRNA processing protein RimM
MTKNTANLSLLRRLGTVRRAHSINGQLIVGGIAPNFLGLPAGSSIVIGFSEQFAKPYIVRECEPHGASRDFTFVLEGITTPEEAAKLREMAIFAADALVRENSSSEYLEEDIIGCAVFDVDTRERLGTMQAVWYMPASEVWVLDADGREVPIPAVPAFIKRVDISKKEIDVFVMEGLMELADTTRPANDNERDDDNDDDNNENMEAA